MHSPVAIAQHSDRPGHDHLQIQQLDLSDHQDYNHSHHDQSSTCDKQSAKWRWIYVLSIVIFAIVLGSVHYSRLKYDTYNHANKAFNHQDHQIKIAQEFPHDKKCYSQGLSFLNKTHLVESCGLWRESYFMVMEYTRNGMVTQIKQVFRSPYYKKQNLFFEGAARFPINNLLYVLTWRDRVVLRFQEKGGKFVQKDRLNWKFQGWGLGHNGSHLIITDGSDKIYITNENLQILQTIYVKDEDNRPKNMLNELEYVEQNGQPFVYANVYLTDNIVKIDLLTGKIVQTYKMSVLVSKEPQAKKNDEVLNGIAYDVRNKQFLLTGKRWLHFYLIKSF